MDVKETLYVAAAVVTILAGLAALAGLLVRHGAARLLKTVALVLVVVTCLAVLVYLVANWPRTTATSSAPATPNATGEQADAGRPKEIVNSIGMRLVPIAPGKFLMGSPPGEVDRQDDEREHEVTITRAFYLAACEVTQEEFRKVMGSNPSHHQKGGGGDGAVAGLDTARLPVENVSWADARLFCQHLSAAPEEKKAGRMYRLPTEAEWEYACRAGTTTAYSFGNSVEHSQVNFRGGPGRSAPVGSYPPNAWGLYDMHGNVAEWCDDWYGPYAAGPATDPAGPASGSEVTARGSAYDQPAWGCRSACRGHPPLWRPSPGALGYKAPNVGFRVAMELKGQ